MNLLHLNPGQKTGQLHGLHPLVEQYFQRSEVSTKKIKITVCTRRMIKYIVTFTVTSGRGGNVKKCLSKHSL